MSLTLFSVELVPFSTEACQISGKRLRIKRGTLTLCKVLTYYLVKPYKPGAPPSQSTVRSRWYTVPGKVQKYFTLVFFHTQVWNVEKVKSTRAVNSTLKRSSLLKPYPPRLYITGTSKIPILVATTLYTTSPPISASPPMRASGEILSRIWRIRANLRISCPRRGSNV